MTTLKYIKPLMITEKEAKALRKTVGRYFRYELRPYFKNEVITDENHWLYALYCKIKSMQLNFKED